MRTNSVIAFNPHWRRKFNFSSITLNFHICLKDFPTRMTYTFFPFCLFLQIIYRLSDELAKRHHTYSHQSQAVHRSCQKLAFSSASHPLRQASLPDYFSFFLFCFVFYKYLRADHTRCNFRLSFTLFMTHCVLFVRGNTYVVPLFDNYSLKTDAKRRAIKQRRDAIRTKKKLRKKRKMHSALFMAGLLSISIQ